MKKSRAAITENTFRTVTFNNLFYPITRLDRGGGVVCQHHRTPL